VSLNTKQKAYLRALAHHRRVIVTVGTAGLTEPVLGEIDKALASHELLKIRLPALQRSEREDMLSEIGEALEAELIQSIGRVGVLYRRGEKPKITVPD
jgi:RNA-binding protein